MAMEQDVSAILMLSVLLLIVEDEDADAKRDSGEMVMISAKVNYF